MDEILSLGRFTQKEIFEIPSSLRKIIEQRTLINKLAKVIVEKEVKHIELELQYRGESTKDEQSIANFWDKCLKRLESVPEYKYMIEQNDVLLDEAKEIRNELIKRIAKVVE